MARPRSEDKRIAILDAAMDAIAAQGLGAPTAQIAKLAGVAEGTLFRYFATKDDLLNELYLHLSHQLSNDVGHGLDETTPLKARARALWNSYIAWGIANPAAHSAINQLAVSEKIKAEVHEASLRLCPDVNGITDNCEFEGLSGKASQDFADAMLAALAQTTINFVTACPDAAQAYQRAGFDFWWKGLVGE
jgi:AcrR family transcriptional regulator